MLNNATQKNMVLLRFRASYFFEKSFFSHGKDTTVCTKIDICRFIVIQYQDIVEDCSLELRCRHAEQQQQHTTEISYFRVEKPVF